MDRDFVNQAKDIAKSVITDTTDTMRESFKIGQTGERKELSPKDQLKMFIRMDETDLDRIRETKGDTEFYKYLTRMNALMEEELNGSI